MKFGMSPSGSGEQRQGSLGSETKGGQTNYDDLYADILLWLRKAGSIMWRRRSISSSGTGPPLMKPC
ncbi:MAG: hypothetical protein QM664_00650 [Flavihumibacter sp.]